MLFKFLKGRLFGTTENHVEKWIHKALYNYALVIGRYPWLFVCAPLLLMILLSSGIVFMKQSNNILFMYTPDNARSHDERRTAEKFFNDENGIYVLKVIVHAKDDGNILRSKKYIDQVISLIDYLQYNYTVRKNNYSVTFDTVQINHRNENQLAKKFLLAYSNPSLRVKLRYPAFQLGDDWFSLTGVLSGVVTNAETWEILSVDRVLLRFRSAKSTPEHAALLYEWERDFLQPDVIFPSDVIRFSACSDQLTSYEIQHNGRVLIPYVLLSFVILVIFAAASSLTGDWTTCKPWEAIAGVALTIVSVAGAYGILFATGHFYMSILVVVPVLVLALGLDVTFIVIRSWRSTNADAEPDHRLAEAFAEAGPSIVITTLTNVISAAVGTITNTPAIYLFCMSVAVSVSLLFLLQMTLFPAIMVLGGYREQRRMNSCLCCLRAPKSKNVRKKPANRTLSVTSINLTTNATPYIDLWNICAARLAILLHKNWFRVSLALVMVAYWTTSLWGCTRLTLGLTPEKFFLPTSILNQYFRLDNGGLHQALTIYVFISQAPNFTNISQTRRFLQLVETFESLPFSMGNRTTMLFYRPYAKYLSDFLDVDPVGPEFYDNLPFYLASSGGSRWSPYLPGYNGTGVILPKLFFSTSFHAAESWSSRSEFTNIWRQIVDDYPEFRVSLWDDEDENYISDQLDSIPGNTLQDVGITAACMGLVCVLFIPNIFNTFCAMLTILSINVGVFGYLVFWGVALDPISMATLLMSIGFSVDFTSHISFHYYTSKGRDKLAKMYKALSSIGYPMLQSGASTILSVSCLCFVPSYMVWVFFKTVFLVVVLGVFHGLIVLPTFLAWLPENFCHYFDIATDIAEKSDGENDKSRPDIVRDIKTIA